MPKREQQNAAQRPRPGTDSIEGAFEGVIDGHATGWMRSLKDPSSPVSVRVSVDDGWHTSSVANLHRPDLEENGIGDGRHGFKIPLPWNVFDSREHVIRVRSVAPGRKAVFSRTLLLECGVEACLDPIAGNSLTGRAWSRFDASAQVSIDVFLDGERIATCLAGKHRPAFELSVRGAVGHGFSAPLPNACFDGNEHDLVVTMSGSRIEVPGGRLHFQSRYSGMLDRVKDGVHGWVWDASRPDTPVAVDIYVNERRMGTTVADIGRGDLKDAHIGNGVHGFSWELEDASLSQSSFTVDVRISGTNIGINASPAVSLFVPETVRVLHEFLRSLHRWESAPPDQTGPATKADIAFLRRFILPPVRQQIGVAYSTRTYRPMAPYAQMRANAKRPAGDEPIDVIIPVYSGAAETIDCLTSVLTSAVSHPHEVIAILDDPENREMARALAGLQETHPFTLLVNEKNLGFIQTVNKGMELHLERDVVLLNSDTVVFSDWLDRLRKAAYSDPLIGTVTPFSNNATICSYPVTAANNTLPEDVTAADLDVICHAVNDGQVGDLPTGVGFCFYIRRDCLNEVGLFDAPAFGQGYGEEADFCQRAAGLGWRSVIAADTFVRHIGSVSFGLAGATLSEEHQDILLARYPYYDDTVQEFIRRDPLVRFRRNIDILRMTQATDPLICFVATTLAGGMPRHLSEHCAALRKQGWSSLIIRSTDGRRVTISTGDDSLPNLVYDLPAEFDALANDLRRLNIRHFHIHSIIGLPPEVFRLPQVWGLPYDCTVHDYSWFCPRVHLVDETRLYCGEPAPAVCTKCIQLNGVHEAWLNFSPGPRALEQLIDLSRHCLTNARKVFCPSEDAKERMRAHFQLSNLELRPHAEVLACRPGFPKKNRPAGRIRVVLIGAVSIPKGLEILKACAFHALKQSQPLDFVVIGHTADDAALEKLPNVSVTGKYAEEEIWGLLREHEPDLALFPNVWPETYSYTLSIAFACRIFPVAFDIGAIAERIRNTGFGRVIPYPATAAEVNRTLLECAAGLKDIRAPQFEDTVYPDVLRDYYDLPPDTAKSLPLAADLQSTAAVR